MARTKKTVRFDGRVAGIKVTVESDRYGAAERAKRKIIDAAWKKVEAAARAAAASSTEYGRALIGTDPRRVETGYMQETFSVDASKGGKSVQIGCGNAISRTTHGRRTVLARSSSPGTCAPVCAVNSTRSTGWVSDQRSTCRV